MKVGIVSGYFNPVHLGHIQYMQAAKGQCTHLIAIINSDAQVKIKGTKPFMDQEHRRLIVSALKPIDDAWISIDTDKYVCKTIEKIRITYPHDQVSFFNSGDRSTVNTESVEYLLCQKLGIKYVAISLPKLYSSSKLLDTL
jgi:cytidyltransferase-like protein